MLILLILTGLAHGAGEPAGRPVDSFPEATIVPDTVPNDITRLFTREEFRRGLRFLFAEDEADLVTRAVYEPEEGGFIGVNLAEGTLLALALLSDDAARRVVAYRPKLAEKVQKIRADPEAARASIQRLAPPRGPEDELHP